MNNMPRVAFICVHNSCRSQIAEAIAKLFASDVFESYSAGTEVKPQINQDAVRIMKKRYDMDMEKTQHPKLLVDIPDVMLIVHFFLADTRKIGIWMIQQVRVMKNLVE